MGSPVRYVVLTLLVVLAPQAAAAQTSPRASQPGVETPSIPERGPQVNVDPDANRTRAQLHQLFQQYPPSVLEILRLDPTLLTNQTYLTPYPALAAFLGQHAEVAHNPLYFLGSPRSGFASPGDPATRRFEMVQEVLAGLAFFIAFMAFVSVVVWVIKMAIEHRRWLRMSRVQTETHAKLLDRFTSNEDLLAYVQSPAGRRFVEFAPVYAAPAAGAPLGRILWSVQAGIVGSLIGLGFLFLSRRAAADTAGLADVAPVFFMIGVVALAGGLGFVISAAASYFLSRQLGLFSTPSSSHA
jgi:hypothetical protein